MDNWKAFAEMNRNLLQSRHSTEEQCREAIKKFEKYVEIGMNARSFAPEAWYLFCPIYGGQCRTDCLCFKEHMPYKEVTYIYDEKNQKVYDLEKKEFKHTTKWRAMDWRCTHVLVEGVLMVNIDR